MGLFLASLGGFYFWHNDKDSSGLGGLLSWRGDSSNAKILAGDAQTYDGGGTSDGSFSMKYPKDFTIQEFPIGEEGKKFVFESKDPGRGMEISVIPFDESGSITPERIKQDLPDAVINNPQNVSIIEGVSALSFASTDEYIGDTFEVWFLHNGYLYQATTYRAFASQMEEMLKTMKFK